MTKFNRLFSGLQRKQAKCVTKRNTYGLLNIHAKKSPQPACTDWGLFGMVIEVTIHTRQVNRGSYSEPCQENLSNISKNVGLTRCGPLGEAADQ